MTVHFPYGFFSAEGSSVEGPLFANGIPSNEGSFSVATVKGSFIEDWTSDDSAFFKDS